MADQEPEPVIARMLLIIVTVFILGVIVGARYFAPTC